MAAEPSLNHIYIPFSYPRDPEADLNAQLKFLGRLPSAGCQYEEREYKKEITAKSVVNKVKGDSDK